MRSLHLIKYILLVIFLFSRNGFLSAQEERAPEKIKVVVLESSPFVMKTEQGFTGSTIDLREECAKRTDIAYEYIEVLSLKDLLASISSGKSDVAVAEQQLMANVWSAWICHNLGLMRVFKSWYINRRLLV